MQKVPRIARLQGQRVERSLTYFLNALHQRALHGNSVVGNSHDHDIGFIPTFSQAQSHPLRFPLYLEFFLLRQRPQNLAPCISQPCSGVGAPIHQTNKGAKTSDKRGQAVDHLEIYLAIENCQVKRRHSFNLPLQHHDIHHIIIIQTFRNNFFLVPLVGSRSVTLHSRLELNGCLALAFRDPG